MTEYWVNILNHTNHLAQLQPTDAIYLANELPIHHFIQFQKLLQFKIFNWNKSSWHLGSDPSYNSQSLSIDNSVRKILQRITNIHNRVSSIEIWNSRMLTPTYNQIQHWVKSRLLIDRSELTLQLDEIGKLISHLRTIAKTGYKCTFGNPEAHAPCTIYTNDLSVNSELIYVKSEKLSIVYTMYDAPNYLRSQDTQVCNHAKSWLNELLDQSILISQGNTQQRDIFFKTLLQEYDHQRRKIELLFSYINE